MLISNTEVVGVEEIHGACFHSLVPESLISAEIVEVTSALWLFSLLIYKTEQIPCPSYSPRRVWMRKSSQPLAYVKGQLSMNRIMMTLVTAASGQVLTTLMKLI